MPILIGQFLTLRAKNPDTPADPYDFTRESLLELDLPEVPFDPSRPSLLGSPPPVVLSNPQALPPPPNVSEGHPSALPPPPAVVLSTPSPLPVEVAPPQSVPATLPLEPAPQLSTPAILPAPPPVSLSVPGGLPLPPLPPRSNPAPLPAPPQVGQSRAALLPGPPGTIPSLPMVLPPPPAVKAGPRAEATHEALAVVNPNSGYKILGETYSPVGGGSPGDLATDPFIYERSVERTFRLPPGKLAVHALTQVGLFAQNVYGTIWNPAMVDPPPIGQGFIMPAVDLPFDGKTEGKQTQIANLVNEALNNNTDVNTLVRLDKPQGALLAFLPPSNSLKRIHENVKDAIASSVDLASTKQSRDPILKTAFANGIIPMILDGDNKFGFRTFQGGKKGSTEKTDDDSVYVPLSFTDLRPIGNTYRIVYFRPLITNFSEAFTPEWNKSAYLGRVDPVATYQGTGRSISLGFKMVAFGPEDVRTIYQKLNWLTSMVYPEYDSNLAYKSGPVVRMRIGDVINAVGTEGARGLPGIIESLDFDYSDKIWELKQGFKVPREIDVALTFTVLHDVPIGRGLEGMFGGLGSVDPDTGQFTVDSSNTSGPDVNTQNFRNVGSKDDFDYGTLDTADRQK